VNSDSIVDTVALADDLAGFLGALSACTPVGPSPGAHSFQRGGPVTVWDDQVEGNLRSLRDEIDVAAAKEVWSWTRWFSAFHTAHPRARAHADASTGMRAMKCSRAASAKNVHAIVRSHAGSP
jgi:hypothetical protein